MVKKLLHTRYRVADLEKTVSFYRDVLGLQEIRRQRHVFVEESGRAAEIVGCVVLQDRPDDGS